jgi:hypothetical protein
VTTDRTLKIALVERGDLSGPARRNPRLESSFIALERLGASALPILYSETIADQVRAQLLTCDGVLVWVNPMVDGVDRTELDRLLREVAAAGVWVSAHPDQDPSFIDQRGKSAGSNRLASCGSIWIALNASCVPAATSGICRSLPIYFSSGPASTLWISSIMSIFTSIVSSIRSVSCCRSSMLDDGRNGANTWLRIA